MSVKLDMEKMTKKIISKNIALNNTLSNSTNNFVANNDDYKKKPREFFINEFIKKYPKAKLQTLIEANKYYEHNYIKTNTDCIQSYP